MKILVTSARLPHALGVIRALGEAGHEVYASDTFRLSPGLHSTHVREHFVTASPTFETRTFVGQIADTVKSRNIDLVLPAFEEVFYLSRHLGDLATPEKYFCAPLEALHQLHDKAHFSEMVTGLGLPVGRTITATSEDELRAAVDEFPEYFGRAVFSRGGVALLTNTGPLAGTVSVDECSPTPENPWIVQEFVHGEDLCSYSVVHHGKIAGHCTYRHPLTIEHAGGIVFESIDEPKTLEFTRRIVEHLGYHGSISIDWMRLDDGGLHVVECNPRPTAGIFTMESEPFAKAVTDPDLDDPYIAAPGNQQQIDVAILRDMFREPADIPEDLKRLMSGTKDVYSQKGDRWPGLYVLLAYSHVFAFRHRMHVGKHKHSDLMEAQFFDISWDGGEID
ncbi:MAG: ATP-grasp domain-containing protein [Myxococcota bacterium]|jgi:predicted ATP-grasp superfamily ATP-dependent carboligase|nr:ATP-grasp domain-containing protein [bacterium]MDP6076518.1 ATP-grasp domain-containing protein [Myxococcota bacterium]MDP6242192.1 ATP-grasp domain-containing protein [Myxococcota bacterium]MDP7075698.1 ATP-grasp domain-containing protein [Myxococcota bacterium]MDP7297926.1 ATP-grasp domain-containing protein [Myxococcota bacterium]